MLFHNLSNLPQKELDTDPQKSAGCGCILGNTPAATNYDSFSTSNERLGVLDIAGELLVGSLPVGKIKQQKTKTHNYTLTEEQGRQGSVNALETETLRELFHDANCLISSTIAIVAHIAHSQILSNFRLYSPVGRNIAIPSFSFLPTNSKLFGGIN